jgi:hypothetical protein
MHLAAFFFVVGGTLISHYVADQVLPQFQPNQGIVCVVFVILVAISIGVDRYIFPGKIFSREKSDPWNSTVTVISRRKTRVKKSSKS